MRAYDSSMRSRISWRFVVLLALPVAWGIAVGCSSFSGDSPASAPSEAGLEAALPVETGGAIDAAARFCKTGDASTAVFCADFDEGPVEAGWPIQYTLGGRLELTPSDRSPPNALLATVDTFPPLPVNDAGDAGDAGPTPYGVAVLSTSVGRLGAGGARLELDIRIDELPTALDGGAAGGQLASVGINSDTQSVAFSFFQGGFFLVVHDPSIAGGTTTLQVNPPSAPGWFHVELLTAFDGSGAALFFNGVRVATAPQGIKSESAGLLIEVGPAGAGALGKARVAYDNVTLTLL
jgi:hypothetical protein